MNKIYWVLVVLGLIGGLFFAKNYENRAVGQKQIIKIGVIAPLSGSVSFLGEGVKNSTLMALKDLKSRNTKYDYEVIFEDDAFSPAKTATAANKLISVDDVDVIVTVASGAGGVANPIAEKSRVIHFGIASDPNIAKGKYNFINWTPPNEEVKAFLNEAEKRGIKKIAVFGQQISGITAVMDEMRSQVKEYDIEIVSENISNFGDKDFRTSIQKAKISNPDYFVLLMFSPELEIMTKQIREAGVKIPITAIESFELSDDPTLFEGLWYVNAADPTDKFSKQYQSVYGKNPSVATPNAYDIVGLVSKAVEKFDGKVKPTADEIASELVKINDYDGALGDNVMIGADHVVVTKAVTRVIKDGKPITIK